MQAGLHADAAASLSRAVSQKHAPAAAHLSWLLLFGGVGIPQDRSKAFSLVRCRQFAGCCHCQGCLACCYAEGWGTSKNLTRALRLAETSAASGSAFGLYMMGWFSENGNGVAVVNRPLALAYYKHASSLGLAAAHNNAGFMCAAGDGVPRDLEEAIRHYKLAVAQGDCDAQYNLACMLESGWGTRRDIDHALRLYTAAAEQGHRLAMYDLAYMHQHGTIVVRDYAKAASLYRQAARLGAPLANNNLAYMCVSAPHAPPMLIICKRYRHGLGVAKSCSEAARLYKLAAGDNVACAQFNLGFMYQKGVGVRQDLREAVRLYKLAADQGDADARRSLSHANEYAQFVRTYSAALPRYVAAAHAVATWQIHRRNACHAPCNTCHPHLAHNHFLQTFCGSGRIEVTRAASLGVCSSGWASVVSTGLVRRSAAGKHCPRGAACTWARVICCRVLGRRSVLLKVFVLLLWSAVAH